MNTQAASPAQAAAIPMHAREGHIWMDGEFVPWRDARVHVLTHSLHYGMGAFEGIRAYQTEKGAAIFRLTEHVTRLFESAHILQMEIPRTEREMEEVIVESVRRNQLTNAYIRPLAFYGAEGMGLRADNLRVHMIVAAWDWGKYIDAEKQRLGLRVKTSSYTRHHVNVSMCKAKCSGHYVNSMLALHEVTREGYDEALLLDVDGFVAEGTGENVFILRHGTLFTPELTSCLDGITRRTIIQLAQDKGLRVVEKRLTRDEVYVAEEAFFTGTAAEIAAISSVDGRRIGTGERGLVTAELSDAYFALVEGRNPDYHHWLRWC